MEKEFIEKIEELNLEIINLKKSKEYQKGKDLIKLKNMLKNFKFVEIFNKFSNRKKMIKLNAHGELENDFKFDFISDKKPKIVVYTAILGGYDDLKEPLLKLDNIDYVAFLDKNLNCETQWNIKSIPENIKELKNNTLINRYLKFHPSELFKDYDYAIYIDGNIKVISDLTSMTYSVNKEIGISLHKHQYRDCVYNEIEACKLLKKGNYKLLKEQVERYKAEGFPNNYGMLEGTVIVSDLNNDKATNLLNEWWEEFKNSESLRDQIALPYVLWRNNIRIDDVGNLGNNLYKNPKIRVYLHE